MDAFNLVLIEVFSFSWVRGGMWGFAILFSTFIRGRDHEVGACIPVE